VKIRTAIFGVYACASALGFAVLMAFILKEVRPRYVESMRRTLADTAALLAVILEGDLEKKPVADLAETWRGNLGPLERASGGLRVYVTDARGIVAFDSDYAFTVTNVVIHGVPYLVLVYWYGWVRRTGEPRPPDIRPPECRSAWSHWDW